MADNKTQQHTNKTKEDRRMAYFSYMKDVRAKRGELERVVKELIKLMDEDK